MRKDNSNTHAGNKPGTMPIFLKFLRDNYPTKEFGFLKLTVGSAEFDQSWTEEANKNVRYYVVAYLVTYTSYRRKNLSSCSMSLLKQATMIKRLVNFYR
jgi:hypothetical protein